jgi:hypothetical protein
LTFNVTRQAEPFVVSCDHDTPRFVNERDGT